jgi:ABC-type amino acid transport substrate-binding protein
VTEELDVEERGEARAPASGGTVNLQLTARLAVFTRVVAGMLAVIAVAATLSACGGSDDSSSSSDGAATTTTSSAAGSGEDAKLAAMLPEKIKSSGKVTFGALWETPPIIGVEGGDTSKPVGITPDLAAAIGKILGVQPEWKNMQWPAQLPGLQSGNVDALFGQVSDGKEREAVIDLVGFYQSPLGLLVASGNPKHIKTMADTCGLKIGIPAGSQQGDVVKGNSEKFCTSQGKPAIKAAEYPGAQGAIVGVKAGNVDAWMDATASVRDIAKKSKGTFDSVVLPDEQIDPYMERIVGIAVNKQNPGLSNALAGAMQKLAADGQYKEIMDKWGAGDSLVPTDKIKVNVYTGTPAGEKPSGTSTTDAGGA